MTTKHDRLDDVPQLPQDWANHIFYGGALSSVVVVIIALVAKLGGAYVAPVALWYWALSLVLLVATAKKLWDYFYEHETVATCVGKILVTVLVPLYVLVMGYAGLLPAS